MPVEFDCKRSPVFAIRPVANGICQHTPRFRILGFPKDISGGYAPLDVHRSVSGNPHLRNAGLGGFARNPPPKRAIKKHFDLTKLYQQQKRPTSIDNDRPRAHTCYRSGASASDGAMGFGKAIVTKFVAEGARVLILDIMELSPEEARGDSSKNTTCLRGDMSSSGDWQEALGRVLSVDRNQRV
ncbi:hypothetical protein N7501_010129 [Penicillium viridicatum]|nr:hypothetical protein N7501_010129 [Penicillium viridicatum]